MDSSRLHRDARSVSPLSDHEKSSIKDSLRQMMQLPSLSLAPLPAYDVVYVQTIKVQ